MGHGDQERERDKRKVLWPSFVRVSVAMIKHNDQKQLGEQSMDFSSDLHIPVLR